MVNFEQIVNNSLSNSKSTDNSSKELNNHSKIQNAEDSKFIVTKDENLTSNNEKNSSDFLGKLVSKKSQSKEKELPQPMDYDSSILNEKEKIYSLYTKYECNNIKLNFTDDLLIDINSILNETNQNNEDSENHLIKQELPIDIEMFDEENEELFKDDVYNQLKEYGINDEEMAENIFQQVKERIFNGSFFNQFELTPKQQDFFMSFWQKYIFNFDFIGHDIKNMLHYNLASYDKIKISSSLKRNKFFYNLDKEDLCYSAEFKNFNSVFFVNHINCIFYNFLNILSIFKSSPDFETVLMNYSYSLNENELSQDNLLRLGFLKESVSNIIECYFSILKLEEFHDQKNIYILFDFFSYFCEEIHLNQLPIRLRYKIFDIFANQLDLKEEKTYFNSFFFFNIFFLEKTNIKSSYFKFQGFLQYFYLLGDFIFLDLKYFYQINNKYRKNFIKNLTFEDFEIKSHLQFNDLTSIVCLSLVLNHYRKFLLVYYNEAYQNLYDKFEEIIPNYKERLEENYLVDISNFALLLNENFDALLSEFETDISEEEMLQYKKTQVYFLCYKLALIASDFYSNEESFIDYVKKFLTELNKVMKIPEDLSNCFLEFFNDN